jgi:hypothetical protein
MLKSAFNAATTANKIVIRIDENATQTMDCKIENGIFYCGVKSSGFGTSQRLSLAKIVPSASGLPMNVQMSIQIYIICDILVTRKTSRITRRISKRIWQGSRKLWEETLPLKSTLTISTRPFQSQILERLPTT